MLGRSHGEHELQAPKLEPAPMMKNSTSLKFVQTLFLGTVTVAGSLDCRNAGHNRNWSNQLRLLVVPDKILNLCEIIKTNEQRWLNFFPHNCISSMKSCLKLAPRCPKNVSRKRNKIIFIIPVFNAPYIQAVQTLINPSTMSAVVDQLVLTAQLVVEESSVSVRNLATWTKIPEQEK